MSGGDLYLSLTQCPKLKPKSVPGVVNNLKLITISGRAIRLFVALYADRECYTIKS